MTTDALTSSETSIRWWQEKSVWIMLLLGFSAGIPILLIFSSLSLWLREAGVAKSSVTFFSWAALGYSFKFIWAPLIDKIPVPILSRLMGRRRGWLLVSQCAVIATIVWMAFIDPQQGLVTMAFAAVMLGFSSATQDVVIDAFRIESANARLQAMLASTYLTGYRIAMIVAGAGALYLADYFGSTTDIYSYTAWKYTYLCMALCMLVGVMTTLCIAEPARDGADDYPYATQDYVRFFTVFLFSVVALVLVFLIVPSAPSWFQGGTQSVFEFFIDALTLGIGLVAAFGVAKFSLNYQLVNTQMVEQGYLQPIQDFFKRYGRLAIWVLLLVGFYRVSDIVLGIIANVFYQDMGYTKTEIASVTKFFGVFMTIAGSFIGAVLVIRLGVMRTLLLGAVLVVITNLAFVWLNQVGVNHSYLSLSLPWFTGWKSVTFPQELTFVIVLDNLTQGISLIAFISWLSSLTNVSFTATQYAIFSSLMTLFPKLLGGYSGTIVEAFGYNAFFFFASALGVPIIILIAFLTKHLQFNK